MAAGAVPDRGGTALRPATGVWATGTSWPDLAVAAILAGLFLGSSVQITRQALAELSATRAVPGAAERPEPGGAAARGGASG